MDFDCFRVLGAKEPTKHQPRAVFNAYGKFPLAGMDSTGDKALLQL